MCREVQEMQKNAKQLKTNGLQKDKGTYNIHKCWWKKKKMAEKEENERLQYHTIIMWEDSYKKKIK